MEIKNEYQDGFIYGFEIDEKMCDDLIDWFEEIEIGEHPGFPPTDTVAKFKGTMERDISEGGESENLLEKLKSLYKRGKITKSEFHERAGKQSTDLSFGAFNSHPALRNYLDKGLASVIRQYSEKFPHAFDGGTLGFVAPGCMPDGDERGKTGRGSFPWMVGTTMNIQKYEPGEGYFCWHTEKTIPLRETVDRALVFMTYLNDVPDGGTKFFHQGITTPAKKGLTLIWPVDWTHVHAGQITEKSEKYIITGWINYVRGFSSNKNTIPYFYDLNVKGEQILK
tara:strand:+ start:169 stop:1011 length:843 start_codon:yes stop_codon:yes gene_type:complete